MSKIIEALNLLDKKVEHGEKHSDVSRTAISEAIAEFQAMERLMNDHECAIDSLRHKLTMSIVSDQDGSPVRQARYNALISELQRNKANLDRYQTLVAEFASLKAMEQRVNMLEDKSQGDSDGNESLQ